jgi:hypothetical protein
MSGPSDVLTSFLYVEDKRPVLVFDSAEHAKAFKKEFKDAESYDEPTHIFLPKPHGLMAVRAGKNGQTAYVFHYNQQAENWASQLRGHGIVYKDNAELSRVVYIGRAQV